MPACTLLSIRLQASSWQAETTMGRLAALHLLEDDATAARDASRSSAAGARFAKSSFCN